ncbi:chitin synthase-domain-containing protein [Fusarium tricinctum]|uniref:chitin synthase n=1 Tax=Fusarium tricinctum TaxID=61284 RepID=A0A8K0WG19_9HYPO|nr:chitin synthase-domain-containing protein [Fusarium tricinctum]
MSIHDQLTSDTQPRHNRNLPLLDAIRASYLRSRCFQLDARTSVVVNSCHSSSSATPILDTSLGMKVWEHAKRRAEDNCILLQSLHESTPSLLTPFLNTLPINLPTSVVASLQALQPFLYCVTPDNSASSRYAALALTLGIGLEGKVSSTILSIRIHSLDTASNIFELATDVSKYAFHVFYYIIAFTSTPAEKALLKLKEIHEYFILSTNGTSTNGTSWPPSQVGLSNALAASDFRQALKDIGIKGADHCNLIATLAGLLTLGNTLDETISSKDMKETCDEAGLLLSIEPSVLLSLSHSQRHYFITSVYGSLVNWVASKANDAIASELENKKDSNPLHASEDPILSNGHNSDDRVQITIVEIPEPSLGRAIAMQTNFDKTFGINAEARHALDLRFVLDSSRTWYHLSLYPGSDITSESAAPPTFAAAPWSTNIVLRQLLSWRLQDWADHKSTSSAFTVDFGVDEFLQRYSTIIGNVFDKHGIEQWFIRMGWRRMDAVVGHQRVWMSEEAWWQAEERLETSLALRKRQSSRSTFNTDHHASALGRPSSYLSTFELDHSRSGSTNHLLSGDSPYHRSISVAAKGQTDVRLSYSEFPATRPLEGSKTFGSRDPEVANPRNIETNKVTWSRRIWVGFVWALTFWIPSVLLHHVGRLRRPDVQQAWREKLVLFSIILLINGTILFWMMGLGTVLCPNSDKAWTRKEVATHQGEDDFWVSIHGKVYDISDFWKRQHSDTDIKTTTANMQPLSGFDLDDYFVPPLHMACRGLGIAKTTRLQSNNTPLYTTAIHTSGYYAADKKSALHQDNWYWDHFNPSIKEYYKGDLVYSNNKVKREGEEGHAWVRYGSQIYDLTNYFYTRDLYDTDVKYKFLNDEVTKLWEDSAGKNIKSDLDEVLADDTNKTKHDDIVASWRCIQAIGYKGISDFRETARCQVNNWLLLAFTIIVCAIIGIKFAAALRFGSKRRPSKQDKFVICQIPAYTEDEESLRRSINSLAALDYDNQRKLLCIICDGIVVGQGNERPTSKIILDIVDNSSDPAALPFKSIGSGSEQLNYGKVYSGLYEFEGNIVPYLIIIKVGRQSEQARPKPGNRGKRDTQMLLMSFLNRVYHESPMNPLEHEMFHHINDVIGVDPRLYEFLLMVDADTAVHTDALNHLVAACANNTQIAGICGETTLENDERSWWTMIQIYEYFISHHLAKAFESLFGSVTCLPGCFTMYRIRSYDGKKPIVVSDAVLQDYSICDVDTLHLKNLLSLGEDRYLTTLMIKHFPRMWLKFLPEAQCQTVAPESWKVLLSQRRRWINSTIHNLIELMRLENMCGACCFSMRVIVFADLFGTIIFPATFVYLVYLIIRVATGTGQFPLISIILLAATYGLQALLFLLKRQWQHIGWMVVYLMALPVYSVFLPIYSFWNQDNFSWGNTRVVIGERGDKQVVALDDDEGFDPSSIPLQPWGEYVPTNQSFTQDHNWDRQGWSCSPGPNIYSTRKTWTPFSSRMTLNSQPSLQLGHTKPPGIGHQQSTMNLEKQCREGYEPIPNELISAAIRWTLVEVNLDTVTKRQVRAIIEKRLELELGDEHLAFFNKELDRQLQEIELGS